MRLYSYDLILTDVNCATGTVQGRLTNHSSETWQSAGGFGELVLGLRLTRLDATVAEVEGRAPLPGPCAPGESRAFEIRFNPSALGFGCFWLDAGLLEEGVMWLPQDHGVPARMQVVVTAPAPECRVPQAQAFGNELEHPYRGRPPWTFWSTAVAKRAGADLDPVAAVPFTIGLQEPVATAGSCFAQNIALHLKQAGFNFLCTEPDAEGGAAMFSARYGNIYTAHQLRQLLHRAYGLLRPRDSVWQRPDGRLIDPFRPQLFPAGFASQAEVEAERERHLHQVRCMFEQCNVFVFTLGLTETWINASDRVALPVPPGAIAQRAAEGPYVFRNYDCDAIVEELKCFIADVRIVNPGLRVILTVSPVPLIATYEDKHVLEANTFSKSLLRVAAERVVNAEQNVAYFPSYEIVTSHASGSSYFEDDFRSIKPEGVAHVMRVFQRHYMANAPAPAAPVRPPPPAAAPAHPAAGWFPGREKVAGIICDENLLGIG